MFFCRFKYLDSLLRLMFEMYLFNMVRFGIYMSFGIKQHSSRVDAAFLHLPNEVPLKDA